MVTPTGEVLVATFRVEDGSFGHIDDTGLFTPSGTRGGITYIEAHVGSKVLRTQLTIEISWVQNGAPDDPNAGMSERRLRRRRRRRPGRRRSATT